MEQHTAAPPRAYCGAHPPVATSLAQEFVFSVDYFAAAFGQYAVEGCEGTSPTLMLQRGVEYTFVQEDITNW